jgi:hypothetical protein
MSLENPYEHLEIPMLQDGVRAAGRSFRSSRREDPLPRVAWDEKKSISKGQQKTPGETMGKPIKMEIYLTNMRS